MFLLLILISDNATKRHACTYQARVAMKERQSQIFHRLFVCPCVQACSLSLTDEITVSRCFDWFSFDIGRWKINSQNRTERAHLSAYFCGDWNWWYSIKLRPKICVDKKLNHKQNLTERINFRKTKNEVWKWDACERIGTQQKLNIILSIYFGDIFKCFLWFHAAPWMNVPRMSLSRLALQRTQPEINQWMCLWNERQHKDLRRTMAK